MVLLDHRDLQAHLDLKETWDHLVSEEVLALQDHLDLLVSLAHLDLKEN